MDEWFWILSNVLPIQLTTVQNNFGKDTRKETEAHSVCLVLGCVAPVLITSLTQIERVAF